MSLHLRVWAVQLADMQQVPGRLRALLVQEERHRALGTQRRVLCVTLGTPCPMLQELAFLVKPGILEL